MTRHLEWLTARPIAHRGLHDHTKGIIENTSSAFAAAMAANYSIECDLQISRDGEAMVFHDETLDRLTNSKGWVNQHSVSELRKVTFANGTDRIQTLSELLEQVDGKVTLVIELKSHWTGAVDLATRALNVLAAYRGPYALMSFDPDLVAALAEQSPNTIRGITADRATDSYYDMLTPNRRTELQSFTHLSRTQPHFVSFAFAELPWAPIEHLRESGHPVITWTIRSKAEETQARRHSDQVTFEGYTA